MTTEDQYLRDVERMLRGIAPAHRQTVVDDLRSHFADAADLGRPVDDVIAGLGSPAEIAERARDEFGTDDAAADRAWRMLQGAAVAVSVVIGVVVAFILPSYSLVTTAENADGSSPIAATSTIAEHLGLGVALIALVPALIAVIPIVVPRRYRTLTAVIVAVVLSAMALIGGFSLGGFFVPSCLLVWAALVVWLRLRGRGFGSGWRIAGAILAALPVVLFAAGMLVPGAAIEVSAWAWPFLAAPIVLAVLIAIGIRSAGWVLAAVGLVVLIGGLISGGLITLLIVWLGGWWLTIGLAHAVATPRRR